VTALNLTALLFLRVTIINPFTTADDLATLMEAIRAAVRIVP